MKMNKKMENTEEMLKALLDGKKIRLTYWNKHEYFHLKDGNILDEEGKDFLHLGYRISKSEFEIYEERNKYDLTNPKDRYKALNKGHKLSYFDEKGDIFTISLDNIIGLHSKIWFKEDVLNKDLKFEFADDE